MAAAAVGASCPQEVGLWVGSAAPQLLPDPWQQPNFSLQDPVLVLSIQETPSSAARGKPPSTSPFLHH